MQRRKNLETRLGALLAVALVAAPARADPITIDRLGVVDGDSILVDGREWRLRGYDTAETVRAYCEGERRLGLIAKRRLEELIATAKSLELTGGETADRYGRPLGSLLVDGRDTGQIMIAEDLARAYEGGRKKGWCSRDSRDDLNGPPVAKRGR